MPIFPTGLRQRQQVRLLDERYARFQQHRRQVQGFADTAREDMIANGQGEADGFRPQFPLDHHSHGE